MYVINCKYTISSIVQITELQRGISGTKKLSSETQRILKKLMTDKFAATYTWIASRGGKLAFPKSWLKQIIFGMLSCIFHNRN